MAVTASGKDNPFRHKWPETMQYMAAMLIISFTVLACSPLSNPQGYHVVSFILLFVVSALSTFLGTGPVFLAASLSALVWNFFFIPPNLTFKIDKTEDILMFGMFFMIAFLNVIFTNRVRRQEQLAVDRERHTNSLFQLTKELSKACSIDEVVVAATREIRNHFNVTPIFVLQDGENNLDPPSRMPKEDILTPEEYKVAEWVFVQQQAAGAGTRNFNLSDITFYPLAGNQINPGVVAVRFGNKSAGTRKELWNTFLAQTANVLEREFLGEMARKIQFLDESARLYKTLFNSISHELRIPVATIIGAADSLINSPHSGNVQSVLIHEISTASLRLNRLIENLLNMSRLESGMLSVRLDWHDINDLFNEVTEDLLDELKPFTLKISIPENMPLVRIDYGLMEQVLYNLIYNSTQYAPAASEISLSADYDDNHLIIQVSDQGPGFPEKELENVFHKFFRLNSGTSGGLGLGLSIAKGFTEAHKGSIEAQNLPEGGARFNIIIPSEKPGVQDIL